jgi:hypothetical protein
MTAAIDNDVLLKAVSYDLVEELLPSLDTLACLGSARFVLTKWLRRRLEPADSITALGRLTSTLAGIDVIEPTREEQEMAADLEYLAQLNALSLDSGESQLCAIVVTRSFEFLLTGDKRAVVAIERLLALDARLLGLLHKVRCLEHLVVQAIERYGHDQLRVAVCGHPDVDKVLSIVFSCASGISTKSHTPQGLASYLVDLRVYAGRVMASS